jgi:molybdopterin converting factor small subunit
MPSILVTLPVPLRRVAGGSGEIAAEGDTVGAALASLRRGYPRAARLFLKEGDEPRSGVSLFLNGSDVRATGGLETPLEEGDRLVVVLMMAGG